MGGGDRDVMTDTTDATAADATAADTTADSADAASARQTPLGLGRDRSTYTNPFDSAPFYRKRWMIVVSALLFIPVTLIILLTGPVYQNDGEVWDQKKRVTTAIALTCFMVFSLSRVLLAPA